MLPKTLKTCLKSPDGLLIKFEKNRRFIFILHGRNPTHNELPFQPLYSLILKIYLRNDSSFPVATSFFSTLCLFITLIGALGYCFLFFKRKWSRRNEPDSAAYIRQTQRNRRLRKVFSIFLYFQFLKNRSLGFLKTFIRRQRTRTTSNISAFSGPRSLSESFSASMRYQWNELDDDNES